MPDLKTQLQQIDINALAQIKRRVWLVGRFNQESVGDPDVYLFTKRKVDDRYRQQFTKTLPLSYNAFVTALRPAMSERIVRKGKLQAVQTAIPRDAGDLNEGTLVIDAFNYFFKRAIANTEQPEFQSDGEQSLLREGDASRGSEILRQIRDNLTRFCEFQPQNHKLLHAAAHLLASAQGDRGMPSAFYAGSALPGGFTEALLDFLYDEDTTKSFDKGYLDRLDFSVGFWTEITEEGRATFCQMLNALRDHLVYGSADNHLGWDIAHASLADLVATALKPYNGLQEQFGGPKGARTAFNSLRQIVRSKVLLSMVLEWVLHSLYDLEPAKREQLPARKVAAIERAVEKGSDGLAKPKVRATPAERRKFSDDIGQNFGKILAAVLADADGAHEVPAAFADLVRQLRGDQEIRRLLGIVSGQEQGKTVFEGFVDACRTILVDVLCDSLYQRPTIDVQDLRRYFRKETTAVYLTAIFLSDENVEKVLGIAEGNLEAFQRQIVDGKITQSEQMQSILLKQFIESLADPNLGKQLEDGLRVLRRVQDLNDLGDASQGFGAGRVAVPRTSREGDNELQETDSGRSVAMAGLKRGLQAYQKKLITKKREVDAAAASAAAASAGDGAAPAPEPAAESVTGDARGSVAAKGVAAPTSVGAAANAEQVPEPVVETSEIDAEIAMMIDQDPEIETMLMASEDPRNVDAVLKSNEFSKAVSRLSDSVKAYEQTLDLIYRRYVDNQKRRLFRNKVERMTLINMMLLWQKDLGLGKVESNLYQMLLDMIQELDPENPDPMDFLSRHSLTKYFDNASLGEGWIGALMNVLKLQAEDSLETVVSFVSELRGVSHLFHKVEGMDDIEIVVINADADEFANWLTSDNLVAGTGKGRLRAAYLRTASVGHAGVWPAMVYMTDIAFDSSHNKKRGFLRTMAGFNVSTDAHVVVPPPILLSTPAQVGGSSEWHKQGTQLAAEAEAGSGPVIVVGPSPLLNDEKDSFRTILPAGYLVLARVLGVRSQGLEIRNVATEKAGGRLAVLFNGAMSLEESLDQLIGLLAARKTPVTEGVSFAVDYYLYLVALLAGALRPAADDEVRFWRGFCFERGHQLSLPAEFNQARVLDPATFGGSNWRRFAVAQNVHDGDRSVESVYQGLEQTVISDNRWGEVTEFQARYQWFDRVRR